MATATLDAATVVRAQRGDCDAREQLFAEVHRRTLRFQLKLSHGNLEDALEATQETMARLIPALPARA
jgi:DNA-directed RNA polymerase specialized sigma24 family protein